MSNVVALAQLGGPAFVESVRRIWDRGDVVAPIDPDAPPANRASLLAAIAPGAIIEPDGTERLLPGGRPTADGDALVICTSGTSGSPKAAVLTHDALEAAAFASATALGVDVDVRWLACLPLHHIGGFGVVARALITGSELVVHPGFDATAVADAAAEGATHTSLVPTTLGRIDPSAFRVILVGGSNVPADRPANCIATYGMTETCGGVVYDGLALPEVAMRIAPDGQVQLRSPTLLRCYRDSTVPFGPDGWYSTGDLGSIDRTTGRLQVEGRLDDVIITGGEKVWPAHVERILLDDPRVGEVAVVGRPDPEWGQAVVALVVPADPATPPPLEDLRWLVRELLPAYAAPRAVELVESIPRTSLGKIRRRAL